jgi:hypothetical protein
MNKTQEQQDNEAIGFIVDSRFNGMLFTRNISNKKKKGYFKVYYLYTEGYYWEEGDKLFRNRLKKHLMRLKYEK